MVRRCAWGTCNADAGYPERLSGAKFITFPNPKTKLEKCLRWIKACGRPHEQLNVDKINVNKVVCSTVGTYFSFIDKCCYDNSFHILS